MKLIVCESQQSLGACSADHAAALINEAIAKKGGARILLSTGASQFPFFDEFVTRDIDWSKVEMFHLDEYVGISKDHPASFNYYLTNRFVNKVNPGKYHLIDGTVDPEKTVAELTAVVLYERGNFITDTLGDVDVEVVQAFSAFACNNEQRFFFGRGNTAKETVV